MDEFRIKESVSTEINPVSADRRYEPEMGNKKFREKIHRESKLADAKNLPFTFSKPKKKGRTKVVSCDSCGHISCVGINTVGIICNKCKIYSGVTEVNHD